MAQDIFAADLFVLRDLAKNLLKVPNFKGVCAGITCLEREGVSVRSMMRLPTCLMRAYSQCLQMWLAS